MLCKLVRAHTVSVLFKIKVVFQFTVREYLCRKVLVMFLSVLVLLAVMFLTIIVYVRMGRLGCIVLLISGQFGTVVYSSIRL